MSEHAEGHAHPYYKVMAWLTFFTIAEIAWVFMGWGRLMLIGGLAVMAGIKAALVGLYYMHLKYENAVLWAVICFPILLVIIMVIGFLPDSAFKYW